MIKKQRIAEVFLVFCVVAHSKLCAQTAVQHPTFVKAYSAGAAILFDEPEEINWEEFAPKQYKDVNIHNPTPKQIDILKEKRNEYNSAEFHYTASAPPHLDSLFYYLISEDGIHPLILDSLEGTVRFKFNETETSIIQRSMFGQIVAHRKDNKPAKSGFVLCLQKPAVIQTSPSMIDVHDYPEIAREASPKPELWKVVYSFSFQIDEKGPLYAFVQWNPDAKCESNCCKFRFSILTIGPTRERVINNDFDCDV